MLHSEHITVASQSLSHRPLSYGVREYTLLVLIDFFPVYSELFTRSNMLLKLLLFNQQIKF
jgi:hypothetical protein